MNELADLFKDLVTVFKHFIDNETSYCRENNAYKMMNYSVLRKIILDIDKEYADNEKRLLMFVKAVKNGKNELGDYSDLFHKTLTEHDIDAVIRLFFVRYAEYLSPYDKKSNQSSK